MTSRDAVPIAPNSANTGGGRRRPTPTLGAEPAHPGGSCFSAVAHSAARAAAHRASRAAVPRAAGADASDDAGADVVVLVGHAATAATANGSLQAAIIAVGGRTPLPLARNERAEANTFPP